MLERVKLAAGTGPLLKAMIGSITLKPDKEDDVGI